MIYLWLQPDENIQHSANSRVPYSVTAIRWLQNFDLLYDVITHAYIPDNYVIQVLKIDGCGQKLYIPYKYVVQILDIDVSGKKLYFPDKYVVLILDIDISRQKLYE